MTMRLLKVEACLLMRLSPKRAVFGILEIRLQYQVLLAVGI